MLRALQPLCWDFNHAWMLSMCSCSLVAHEACQLLWVADAELLRRAPVILALPASMAAEMAENTPSVKERV